MSSATVDLAKCKRDGLCTTVCPMGVLELDSEKLPRVVPAMAAQCIHCGHCVAVCGQGALAIEGIGPQDCQPIRPELQINSEQVAQHFKTRRSVRHYQSKPVPRQLIKELLDSARWAPTAVNTQAVEYLVIDSPEQVRQLVRLAVDAFRPNPGLSRLVQACDAGIDRILRGAPAVILAHAPSSTFNASGDCTIALAHIDLLAPAYGLATCWAGLLMGAIRQNPALAASLNLPPTHAPHGALMLGYAKFQYRAIPPRQELKVQWR